MLPPWAMITPWAPPSGTTISAVTACDLFLMLTTELSVRRPMPPKSRCRLPFTSIGRPAIFASKPLRDAVVERQHVVPGRLDQEQPLQLVQAARGAAAETSSNWVQSTLVS